MLFRSVGLAEAVLLVNGAGLFVGAGVGGEAGNSIGFSVGSNEGSVVGCVVASPGMTIGDVGAIPMLPGVGRDDG